MLHVKGAPRVEDLIEELRNLLLMQLRAMEVVVPHSAEKKFYESLKVVNGMHHTLIGFPVYPEDYTPTSLRVKWRVDRKAPKLNYPVIRRTFASCLSSQWTELLQWQVVAQHGKFADAMIPGFKHHVDFVNTVHYDAFGFEPYEFEKLYKLWAFKEGQNYIPFSFSSPNEAKIDASLDTEGGLS